MNNARELYENEMRARLMGCSKKIDWLRTRAQNAAPREKLKLYDQLEDLVIKERGARVELNSLAKASEEVWEHKQSVLDQAMNSLQNALREAPPS